MSVFKRKWLQVLLALIAVSGPESWFFGPGFATPAPPDAGMRLVFITWPPELLEAVPDFKPGHEDPQARAFAGLG